MTARNAVEIVDSKGETAMDSSAGLAALVFMLFLAAVSIAWHFRKSRRVLERWAEQNGYRIVDAEYRHFFKGPFFWTSSKGQTVYRVTVEMKGGVRSGWVRCGSWWFGLMSDKAEVRWDEPPAVEDRWDEPPAVAANPMHDRWLDG
jgi:hypothetical protein